MRRSTTLLGIVLAAPVLSLIFSSETDACWRSRRCMRPCITQANETCAVPDWVRSIQKAVTCPAGYKCMCCESGSLVDCGANCDPNSQMCVKAGVAVKCPEYKAALSSSRCCPSSYGCLYAMICDCKFHCLRYALPGEDPDGFFPIQFLGTECSTSKK